MIAAAALFLVVSSIGLLAGMQLHEAAHYVVLRLASRSPKMHYPSLADGRISAQVTFDVPDDQIPADVRLAALAPLLAALTLALPLLLAGVQWQPFGVGFSVAALIRTAKLSRQDLRMARGQNTAG